MLLNNLVFKPRSILQLTVTGFLAVAGILIVALFVTARQINALGERNERVLSQSADGTQAARIIIEQATAMERNARQYQVIGDRNYLKVYRERQLSFAGAIGRMSSLGLDDDINASIIGLLNDETGYYQKVQAGASQETIQTNYQALRDKAFRLTDMVGSWTAAQLMATRQETARTQELLRNQAIVMTVVALALAALFTRLITRPLAQLEKAVNQLGDGSYDAGIAVDGPADLQHLGNSLEWLRSRLQKLEQQRTAFFRHVSHELKTPLASIQESVALLRDGVAGPVNAEQLQLLTINNNNCQRLQGLIDELLQYHREIQSVLNAIPTDVHVDAVIRHVVASHEFALQNATLQVATTLEPLVVRGDAEQLRVIIDNLLTNAIKFSPEHGTIHLRWSRQDERAVLEVEDEGPGIAVDQRELVFQAFYRGNTPARTTIKSTGLGLAIVHEYVSANRGIIEVMPCETGALFKVMFPLQSV